MSVGTLHAHVVLDEPGKIHCGSRDPVQGHVSILYRARPGNPGAAAELFGPLRVVVVLHGRAKTKIWKSQGQRGNRVYRGRAPLLRKSVLVYDDVLRVQSGQSVTIPFSVSFPGTTDPGQSLGSSRDQFEEDTRFISSRQAQPLPPSFQNSYHSFAHRYEAFVEYRVGVDAAMPLLSAVVDVDTPNQYAEPVVRYERPSAGTTVMKTSNWRGSVSIKSELLLPEAQRPAGFRGKTKALFGAAKIPVYSFIWLCVAPLSFYIGQPARFHVHIKPCEQQQQQSASTTSLIIPDVHLKSLALELVAHTQVRGGKVLFTSPASEGNYTVYQTSGISDTPGEPFTAARGYTKVVETRSVLGGSSSSISSSSGMISSTFVTYNIAVSYTAIVRLAFLVAGKLKTFDTEFGVVVYPPLEQSSAPAPASAPPPPPQWDAIPAITVDPPSSASPIAYDEGGAEEPLPAYEEVPRSKR